MLKLSLLRKTAFLSLISLALLSLLLSSCIKEYDLERREIERGTLGEELHRIWMKDSVRAVEFAEPRAELLERRRAEFISAVDRAVPKGTGEEFDQVLASYVPMVEEGYLPAMSRRIAQVLVEAAEDEDLMQSLDNQALYNTQDFLSFRHRGQLMRVAAEFDKTPQLLAYLGQKLAESDGLNENGEPDIEVSAAFSDLVRALVDWVEDVPAADDAGESGAIFLRDLLLATDKRYRGDKAPRQVYVALFDERGLPKVRIDEAGKVRAPFVDADQDGLADVDEEGRFILDDGQRLAIPPLSMAPAGHPDLIRDIEGRLEHRPGDPAFEYVDISETALPFLIHLWAQLASEGALHHMAAVGRDLLGPTTIGEDRRGPHLAFNEDHPLVDILDALLSGLVLDELPEVLELTALYLERRYEGMAPIIYALSEVGDILEGHDGADIYPNQTLLSDLLEVAREIIEDPQLWADLLEALRDPILERSGESMAMLLRYRDREAVPAPGGPYDACFQQCKGSFDIGTNARFDCIMQCPNDELFSELTDFDAPESEQNRSQLQRIFHLLRDTAGVEYSMAIEEGYAGNIDLSSLPPMVYLPGAAEAFIRAVAGELFLGDYVSEEFTIPGLIDGGNVGQILGVLSQLFGTQLDIYPTPDQITRLFNTEDLRYEEGNILLDIADPRCRDGFIMAHHHADGLFLAEASGMIDVLYPLSKAFAKNNREELLARLFVIIHDHYSGDPELYKDSQGRPSPMKGSNIVSLEPMLLELFEEGTLFRALGEFTRSTKNLQGPDGVHFDERLRQLVRQYLRNDQGYKMRTGPTTIELGDGRTLSQLSRLEVIVERAQDMMERLEGDEQLQEHLKEAARGFMDTVLATDDEAGEIRFREEGTLAMATHLFRTTARRARQMNDAGELEPWLKEDLPQTFQDALSSRALFALIHLFETLHEEEAGRQLLTESLLHFAAEGPRTDQISLLLYGLLVQSNDIDALMPLGKFALRAFDPDRKFEQSPHKNLPTTTLLAHILRMSGESDENGYTLDLYERLMRSGESYDPTLEIVLDIAMRYFSDDPAGQGPLQGASRQAALRRFSKWLVEPWRGIEGYYKLVDRRRRLLNERGQ